MKFLVCLFALLVCDGFAANINFITSTEEDCVRYGQGVKEGIICDEAMKQPFSSIINNVGEMTHDDAVTAIKNIVLAGYYVPIEMIEFYTAYNNALVSIAKSIDERHSVELTVLDALYETQVCEDKLKMESNRDIVGKMICFFDVLKGDEVTYMEEKRREFKNMLKQDNRFVLYCF